MVVSSLSLRCYSTSLGCPKNRVDTERLLGSLGLPLVFIEEPHSADFIFINTCAFIGPAVQESIHTILQLITDIEDLHQKPLFIVAGCFVGRYGEASLKKDLPEVDVWLNNQEIDTWKEQLITALNISNVSTEGRILTTGKSYAWLKISDGCQHTCSFCTIPSIRGGLRSYPVNMLVEESRKLIDQGVKELILVAQDVTSWGKDFDNTYGLQTLLDSLLPLQGLERLRLMYLYPSGLTQELLQYLKAAGEPFVPYFDVPIQHAHKDILSYMGRPFAKDPRKVIDRIRSIFPEAALRTSIITGFPGETEVQHEALLRFIEEVRFQHLGVFTYRPEEGTPAALMSNQVEDSIKEARKKALMGVQAQISAKWLTRFEGEKLSILVDTIHEDWPGLHTGRAWFQAPDIDGVVYVSGPGVAPGVIVEADIIECHEYDLVALTESDENYR